MKKKTIKKFFRKRRKRLVFIVLFVAFAIFISVLLFSQLQADSNLTFTDIKARISLKVENESGKGVADQELKGGVTIDYKGKTENIVWTEKMITGKEGFSNPGYYRICKGSDGKLVLGFNRSNSCYKIIEFRASLAKKGSEETPYPVPFPLAEDEFDLYSKFETRQEDKPNINLPTIVLKSDGSAGEIKQTNVAPAEIEVGVGIPGSEDNFFSYSTYICAIYKWSLKVGFLLTLLMVTLAGYKYLISGGSDTQISGAKEILVDSLLGFAFLLMINFILTLLNVPYCK